MKTQKCCSLLLSEFLQHSKDQSPQQPITRLFRTFYSIHSEVEKKKLQKLTVWSKIRSNISPSMIPIEKNCWLSYFGMQYRKKLRWRGQRQALPFLISCKIDRNCAKTNVQTITLLIIPQPVQIQSSKGLESRTQGIVSYADEDEYLVWIALLGQWLEGHEQVIFVVSLVLHCILSRYHTIRHSAARTIT